MFGVFAMSWGMVAAGVATVAAGAMSSKSARDAAKGQRSAEMAALSAEERMFDKQLKLMAPYRDAGYSAIEGLQALTDPSQRGQMLTDYYKTPEYQAMQNQAETNTARLGSVTSGLRSGSTYKNLESIAPQLGQNYLTNQFNQLSGIANLGMGAASQGVQGAANLGSQQALAQRNMGQAYAQNQLAQANIFGDTAGQLGGLFMNYFNQGGN